MRRFELRHCEPGTSSQWMPMYFAIRQFFWWKTTQRENGTVKQYDKKIWKATKKSGSYEVSPIK